LFLPDILRKNKRKAAAKKYSTCLNIYGCRELGLSEAKGKFTFALKRYKEKNDFQTRRVYEVQNRVSRSMRRIFIL
jgi:hypothetical protein